jgi:hypothetical protein
LGEWFSLRGFSEGRGNLFPRTPCNAYFDSHARHYVNHTQDVYFSGQPSAVERAFPSATPITRTEPSNAHFGGRLSATTGRAGEVCLQSDA